MTAKKVTLVWKCEICEDEISETICIDLEHPVISLPKGWAVGAWWRPHCTYEYLACKKCQLSPEEGIARMVVNTDWN